MSQNSNSLQFALATQLLNALQLIQKNVQQGQAPNVMQINGGSGDLFDICAAVYGDCSLAFALARYNNLLSPILSFSLEYQILLPPFEVLTS